MRGVPPITKEDFESLKVSDEICCRSGTDSPFWVVISVSQNGNGEKTIQMKRKRWNAPTILCKWDPDEDGIVNVYDGKVYPIFQGLAFVKKESVRQIVEEMLSNKEISQRQADRLIEASNNDISSTIGDSHCAD